MKKQFSKIYNEIISLDNLFSAWQEFVLGKSKKQDIREFSVNLTDNLVQLHTDLANFTYKHGGYEAFNISDPKPRNIHKAKVRDRVLHRAIYRQLYPLFDRTFITDSFSCRLNKGVHKAINRFREFGLKASKNNIRTVWVLKLDVRKFFANIDHKVLTGILTSYIPDKQILWLLGEVIDSFFVEAGKGLPLGNLTSQLFCNVYMNEFDQFVKHKLKARYYIRYADDFVLFSDSRVWLLEQKSRISKFLADRLKLSLHTGKIIIKTLASGADFLGWMHFTNHRVIRTSTKRRMFKRIRRNATNETLQSYLGLLKHGNTLQVRQKLLNDYGLWAADSYL